jgi:GT2 family glycosyltransferase
MKTAPLSVKSFNSPLYLAPSAWVEHIPFAFWIVENLKPRMIVELGVHYGVSYFSFCQAVEACHLPTLCYGIDNWQGDEHAGFYTEDVFKAVNTYNAGHYAGFSYLLKSDFNAAIPYFQDGSIDLLHIDGLHLYESVKQDFEQWLPKLSDSSVVLFHDISVREKDFGVYKLWDELIQKYPSFSFVHGHGLGVLCTGGKIPKNVSELFHKNSSEVQIARNIYSKLGSAITEKLKNKQLGEKIESLLTDIETIRKELGSQANTQENKTTITVSAEREKQLLDQIKLLELNNKAIKELITIVEQGNMAQAEQLSVLKEQNERLREQLQSAEEHEKELTGDKERLQSALQESLHCKDSLSVLEHQIAGLIKRIHDKNYIIATKEREIANLKGIALHVKHENEPSSDNSLQLPAQHQPQNTPSSTTKNLMSKVLTITKFTAKSPFWLLKGTFKENYNSFKKRKHFPHVPKELFEDYLLLLNNKLFDAEWYLTQYPDVKGTGQDPILHYMTHGYKESRDPSKSFSTFKYLLDNPDVKKDNKNPLTHYLNHGKSEGRTYEGSTLVNRTDGSHAPATDKIVIKPVKRPVSRITGKNNRREYRVILESELFDETWYFNEYPLVYEQGNDPIEHYLNIGYLEGKDPNPLFCTTWYLTKYADIQKSGDNPFVHYLTQGYKEKRDPHPIFQTEWYFHYNPDCATGEVNPLLHYFKHGSVEGRKVHPLFDERFYTRQTGLQPEDGAPLFHYIMAGWKQGFNPNPFFDVKYYIDNILNGTLEEPLSHFIQEAISQKISPSPYFDTDFYIHTNELNVNGAADPLIHFLTKGIKLLRRPSPLFKIYQFRENGDLHEINHTTDLDKYIQQGELDPVYEYIETKARIQVKEKARLRSQPIKKGSHFELKEADLKNILGQIQFKKVEHPTVSVIIPYYNAKKYIIECLLSLFKKAELDKIEVILVNDHSPDDIKNTVDGIPNLIYLENGKNEGFVKSCNKGAKAAKGDYFLFFNNDAQITENAIELMASTLDNDPAIGIVGPKVLYPAGHLQEAGCKLFPDGSSGFIGLDDDPNLERYNYSKEVDYVSGCSLMIRKEVFEKVGGFSLEFEPGYCEDVDLCMKTRNEGYKIWYNHQATIYHYLSAATPDSYKNFHIPKNEGKLFTKWFDKIQELNEVKILSFYLPQFHPYKENEFWWGKGFTEWTNVSKALPNYEGHVQPQLPTDLGFYDARLKETMENQKKLAEKYGVSGFCFYYYWFAGKRVMELQLDRILHDNKSELPFCLCWANENFTKRWDGGNNEIVLGQSHSDEDDEAVIKDMLKYARHKNYIRVNNKPMVLLYRHSLLPDIARTAKLWRKIAMEIGIGEIYLGFVESFQHAYLMENPKECGFDFSTQFPPHQNSTEIPVPGKLFNKDFTGTVHDYREMVLKYTGKPVPGFKRFPGLMTGWDNTPRQKNKPNIFAYSNPGSFQAWLEWNIKVTSEQNPPGERFIFINAWNEWAEGAILEPSLQHGHGFLEAVRNAKQTWLK